MPELAEVAARHGPAYLARFGRRVPPSHRRALADIAACRTPAMGGRLYACPHCGREHFAYHSCNHRACPKCGHHDATAWLEQLRRLLPPCTYFLVTFTVPSELHGVARSNQRVFYNALFRRAADALLERAAQERFVGGLAGMVGVLHTWTRALDYHPHVHFLVPAGALSGDGERWLRPKYPDYFIPERALAYSFRAGMKAALGDAALAGGVDPAAWSRRWVVQVQKVGDGLPALKYLSRYVYRTALADKRIVRAGEDAVTFTYKESGTGARRARTLAPHIFLQKFLQHVLPAGFTRVRYYGFLAPACRAKLQKVRALLGAGAGLLGGGSAPGAAAPEAPRARAPQCPNCGRPMELVGTIPRARGPPAPRPAHHHYAQAPAA